VSSPDQPQDQPESVDPAVDPLDAESAEFQESLAKNTDTESDADALTRDLDERTADLQRLQAEYANYRKRVDRDREASRDLAVAAVLSELLPVLDDIGRARTHGELEGGFKLVGESLEATVARLGLETFGEVGEAFDPMVHEAIAHSHSDEVTAATCVEVFQPGYRFRDKVVRPARVAVAEPE